MKRLGVAVALVGLALGCSSASKSTSDAGRDTGPVSCSGAVVLPPIVRVFDAVTNAQICDATIAIASDGGDESAGAVPCGASNPQGCPPYAPDGGKLSCIVALDAVEGTVTLVVSAPGYQSRTVPGVYSGTGSCTVSNFGTQLLLGLEPLNDGGGAG